MAPDSVSAAQLIVGGILLGLIFVIGLVGWWVGQAVAAQDEAEEKQGREQIDPYGSGGYGGFDRDL